MCFSAEASFVAGSVLLGVGVVTAGKAVTTPQFFLAAIPLLFSLQQFFEGFVWLSLQHGRFAQFGDVSMYSFLFFAQAVWPVLIPLCVWKLETHRSRRRIQVALLAAGIAFALYLLYCLITYPVSAVIDHHHIRYDLDFPFSRKWYYGLIYFLPTVFAPLLSSVGLMRLLGAVNLISYGIARFFYNGYVVSVWCFLATAISLVAFYIVVKQNKSFSRTAASDSRR